MTENLDAFHFDERNHQFYHKSIIFEWTLCFLLILATVQSIEIISFNFFCNRLSRLISIETAFFVNKLSNQKIFFIDHLREDIY